MEGSRSTLIADLQKENLTLRRENYSLALEIQKKETEQVIVIYEYNNICLDLQYATSDLFLKSLALKKATSELMRNKECFKYQKASWDLVKFNYRNQAAELEEQIADCINKINEVKENLCRS